jgi:uncharacterized protein
MREILILILLLFSLNVIAIAQSSDEATVDSGKLLIFAEGKQIGTETFSIKGKWVGESSGALTVGGNTGEFKAREEYQDRRPLSFVVELGPNMKVQVVFNGTEAKLTSPAQQTAQTDAEALILENNVWHQYHFLIQRYDKQKGGLQQFKAFVPSIMQTIPVTLELKGTTNPLPDKAKKLERYAVVLAGSVNLEILTDDKGKLVYLSELAHKADAVREEYATTIGQLRAALGSDSKSAEIDYSAPANAPFTAEEVTVKSKDWQLAGTLLLPKTGKRPFPAVITITGSGSQTRDEPIGIAGLENYGLMRQVAETLASRGIAVLRVDDRGAGKSTGAETLATVTTSSLADDVRAQAAYLRSRPEIDAKRIALVGHSEGGTIAPMVAATDTQIAAIVLMAGGGKRGDQISMDQINDIMERDPAMTEEAKAKRRAEQQEIIRAVVTGGDLSKYPPQARLPWTKEFWTYDPLATIRKVRQPILILQGALDRQITAEQAGMLERAARGAGNKDVTVRLFPNLNHLFLPAKTGAFSEYSTLETNIVGDDVLKALGDWLEAKLKGKDKR